MNENTESDYQWGLASKLRAHRDWLGLSTEEMTAAMSSVSGMPMSKRSYQRMERGDNAIHRSIWDTVGELTDRMKAEVQAVLEEVPEGAAAHVYRIPGGARFTSDMSGWARAVAAHAVRADPRICPKTEDDVIAEQEMTG